MQRPRFALDDHQIKLMNSKELVFHKSKLYSRIEKRNNSILNEQMLHNLEQHFSKSIENSNKKYFFRISKKLNNPNTSIKCYWSLIKSLLNGKKVLCVPPIYDNNNTSQPLKGNVNFSILTFHNNALYWKISVFCRVSVVNILITFKIPLFFQKKIYIR